MKTISINDIVNIDDTTFVDLLEKPITTSEGNGLKLQFTASVSATYFSTARFKLLIDEEAVAFCVEDVQADGFASLAMQAAEVVEPGEHTIKVQAAKEQAANATFNVDQATLILEEVDIELDPAFSQYYLNFDGDDDSLIVTGYKGVTGTAARSFSWWMKMDELPAHGSIIDYGDTAVGAMWNFLIEDNSGAQFSIINYSDKVAWQEIDNSDLENIIDEEWHHYVLTAPASGTLANLKLYMDGIEQTVPTTLNGSETNSYNTGNNYDFLIGDRSHDSSTPLPAGIDEFAVFSVELSAAEVTAIYNTGTGLDLTSNSGDYESSANLELYYKLEEGTGITTEDVSGNSRDGDIDGATWASI